MQGIRNPPDTQTRISVPTRRKPSLSKIPASGPLRSTATGIRSQPLRSEFGLICLQIVRFSVRVEPLSGGR